MSEVVVDARAIAVGSAPNRSESAATSRPGVAVVVWAVGGVGLTFVEAIYRLGARALATVAAGLTLNQWVALAAGVVVLGYAEGYRALQRRFVPLVIARALSPDVDYTRSPLLVLLAPLHAVALAGASKGAMLRAYASVGLIVGAVLFVRALPDPWRGIVDAAVTVALTWGLVALMVELVHAVRGLRAQPVEESGRASHSMRPGGGAPCSTDF